MSLEYITALCRGAVEIFSDRARFKRPPQNLPQDPDPSTPSTYYHPTWLNSAFNRS